ncbi:MAG: FAD:protein FMN transferase [Treponema sp.]|nr:FAD:protein FMN transferase [Treponema sp.]
MLIRKLAAPVLAVFLCGCGHSGLSGGNRGNAMPARSEYALGTLCRIDLFESGTPGLYERLFARLAELELVLSANRDDSELAACNRAGGPGAFDPSPDLAAVLERAHYFTGVSGGAFNPALGPLIKRWDAGGRAGRVGDIPPDEEIRAALALAVPDYLTAPWPPGAALDLGGIAKGYAADELVRILKEEGAARAVIDLGGNVYVWGDKPAPGNGGNVSGGNVSGGGAGGGASGNGGDGGIVPWRVGIQDPLDERGAYAGILELAGGTSAVTSGVYERYFTGKDGRRYHHILDPATGYPVDNDLLSVTIIASSSMDADALSTACFVLGYEKGRALAESQGVKALFIFTDKTIRGAAGALAAFVPAEGGWRVEP